MNDKLASPYLYKSSKKLLPNTCSETNLRRFIKIPSMQRLKHNTMTIKSLASSTTSPLTQILYSPQRQATSKSLYDPLLARIMNKSNRTNLSTLQLKTMSSYSSIKDISLKKSSTKLSPVNPLKNKSHKTSSCKDLADLNNQIICSYIYQGQEGIKHSKRNHDKVCQFVNFQKKEEVERTNQRSQHFHYMKKLTNTNNLLESLDKSPILPIKKKEVTFNLNNKEDFEKDITPLAQIIENHQKSFVEKFIILNKAKQCPKRGKLDNEKINYALLDAKIKVYNFLQKESIKKSEVEKKFKILNKINNIHKENDSSIKSNTYGIPRIIRKDFKNQTLSKFKGINGKFFGTPV